MTDDPVKAAGLTLPAWLRYDPPPHENGRGTFVIDPDIAYPAVFKALGAKDAPDQYLIEVAYQCVKLATQELVANSALDPRRDGNALLIKIESADGRKERWALKAHPPGRGAAAATRGLEARGHYEHIRGRF